MPLRDHFHGETELELPWPMMAQAWAVSLMGWLNRTLSKEHFQALAHIRTGSQVEADVAEYRRDDLPDQNFGLRAPPAMFTIPARRTSKPSGSVVQGVQPGGGDTGGSRLVGLG